MLYSAALLAHSWLRWIVLGLAIVLVVASLRTRRDWAPADDKRAAAFVGLSDLQLLLGLLLWVWLSPIPRAAWQGGLATLHHSAILVFALLHPILMTCAAAVLHAGHARLKHAEAHRKHRSFAITMCSWLAIVLLAIPWPGLPWGRPLVRTPSATAAATVAVPAAWSRCTACHGATGRGDGPAAAGLAPRPRSFADAAWQAAAPDARIRQVIRGGGVVVGLSPLMPAHADLDDAQLDQLVRFIRALAETP